MRRNVWGHEPRWAQSRIPKRHSGHGTPALREHNTLAQGRIVAHIRRWGVLTVRTSIGPTMQRAASPPASASLTSLVRRAASLRVAVCQRIASARRQPTNSMVSRETTFWNVMIAWCRRLSAWAGV